MVIDDFLLDDNDGDEEYPFHDPTLVQCFLGRFKCLGVLAALQRILDRIDEEVPRRDDYEDYRLEVLRYIAVIERSSERLESLMIFDDPDLAGPRIKLVDGLPEREIADS